MNTENQNQSYNQDTLEQDQNSGAPTVPPEPTSAPAPVTDNCPTATPCNSVPATDHGQLTADENHLPKLHRTRPRIGKIASLPEHLRNWVNEQLVQRAPTHSISKQLENEGYPGIKPQNVSNWRLGGFQDYLQQTESANKREKRWKSLLALARAEGPAFDAAALQMAIGHYHEMLCSVQPAAVTTLIASKPEYFFRLNTGLSSLIKAYQTLSRPKKNSHSSRLDPALAGASNIEFEKKDGLTIEERDEVRRSLGICPPPPKPQANTLDPEQPAAPALKEPAP